MTSVPIPDADGHLSIRITAAEHRLPHQGGGLASGLWRSVVESDPSLRLVDHVMGVDPQTCEPMRIPCPHAARWLSHPEGVPYVFYFRAGAVVLHSGDRHAAAKAQELARLLHAQVAITVD